MLDSYRKYKEDTNKLATWHVKTAQSIPKHSHVASGRSDRKPARLVPVSWSAKRKRRNVAADILAEQQQKQSSLPTNVARGSNSLNPTASIVLPTAQFPALAKSIAKAAVPVPPAVINHIISVLEQVVEILTPHHAVCKRAPAAPAPSDDVTSLANQFEVLSPVNKEEENDSSDDDRADGAEPNDDSTVHVATVPTMSGITYQGEDDLMDVIVIIDYLFDELADIRWFVRDTWYEYRDGKLDLITASLVTNAAVDLVRDLEAEFMPKDDDGFCDALDLMTLYLLVRCP
ncbi:hypothetical protein GGF32_002220 [Allomyces javanicus]|nr:hypothetical protein GGF32_002220 [Allomyces javanicus]